MNWSCEQVVRWCKSFMDDDSILFRLKVSLLLFIIEMHVSFLLLSVFLNNSRTGTARDLRFSHIQRGGVRASFSLMMCQTKSF